ncbi:MAG: HAD-IIIA family hydrolase [Gammaproteobacteria bacterium]|nr:HAD-IIIA family hydrolase [Gammaproteobacteria bacterium]MDE2344843.1 HAD-IIIA family hydrolase [Gammaproteobacteria bacterium]
MQDIHRLASGILLVVFDLDGVFTDGRLYYGAYGEELKCFHVRDGHGIKSLLRDGVQVAVISGRKSKAVTTRMQELGVRHLFQGDDQKQPIYEQLLKDLGLRPLQTACVGDDLADLPLMLACGLAIAVADAQPEIRAKAHWCTTAPGGRGAVREVCDLILAARNAGG